MSAFEKISNYVDSHQQEAAAYLSQLVQQPSTQGNEKGVQAIVIENHRHMVNLTAPDAVNAELKRWLSTKEISS